MQTDARENSRRDVTVPPRSRNGKYTSALLINDYTGFIFRVIF